MVAIAENGVDAAQDRIRPVGLMVGVQHQDMRCFDVAGLGG